MTKAEPENLPKIGQENIAFIHPFTGGRHQVFFYDTEFIGAPAMEAEIAGYVGTAEVVPCLSAGESLRFDSSFSYKRGKGVGAVSIIGGSVGPAAIFFAGKETDDPSSHYGGQMFHCFSKPYWSYEEGKCIFRIIGLDRINKNEEIIQVFGE